MEVCGRVHRWAQSLGRGQVGQSGYTCTVCAKVGMVEIGCGGHTGGTPPIGKVVPLGLVCDEKVLQDGWQGWTDTSKCGNAAGFRMCTRACRSAGGRWEAVVCT